MLILDISRSYQITHENFNFNIYSTASLACHFFSHNEYNYFELFFFFPKNIFWLHTALFWFGYILYVASRKIYYKLPKQPLVDLFHHFLLFQLSGVEIMSSALLPKPSVQVFSCKSPVGFLKPHSSYLMASQRRMW